MTHCAKWAKLSQEDAERITIFIDELKIYPSEEKCTIKSTCEQEYFNIYRMSPIEFKSFLFNQKNLESFLIFHCFFYKLKEDTYELRVKEFENITNRLRDLVIHGVVIYSKSSYTRYIEKRMTTFAKYYYGHYITHNGIYNFNNENKEDVWDAIGGLINSICEDKYGADSYYKDYGYKDMLGHYDY
jgi:hypothetical protein